MSESTLGSNTANDEPALTARHHGVLMAAVMMVTVMQILDMTIANVALPHMQSSLGATMDTVSWILTSYIIATVMTIPLVGWVSDKLGSRTTFLYAVGGFLIASALCGAATSLTQMVFFRVLQGACAAFIGPMSQTILFDINRPSKQASAMSMMGMVVMIAPITGPMLGGILTDTLSWRWVFYVNLPIGIPTLIILAWLLPSRPIVPRRLDRFGFLVLAVALVSMQLMLDRGQHKDWFDSWEIIIELIIALSAIWIFFIHSRSTANPLFPSGLLKDKNFLGGLTIMLILGLANVAIASVLPTMFQHLFGYSTIDTGLLLMPRGLGIMISMFIAKRLMQYMDLRYLMSAGYLICAAALAMMVTWSLEMDSGPILSSGFIQGLGLGLLFTPATMAAFSTLPQQFRPDGSSLLNLVRNIGGSFGISAIFTLISRNSQISHADLSSHITPYSLPGIDPLTAAARLGDTGTAALQLVDLEIQRQASMIAYLDNFYAMAILLLLISILPLLLKPIHLNNRATN
tara:strand:- start:225 stop:1775 length:1551 start_codon:yes stop_codon:yes gene_type:complete